MKTLSLRVWAVSVVAVSSMVLLTGCEEDQARGDVPVMQGVVGEIMPPYLLANAAPASNVVAPSKSQAAPSAPAPLPQSFPTNAVAEEEGDNSGTAEAPPVVPDNVKVTPALAQVIKMVQSGISEEVVLSYIVNSTNIYQVDPDVIIYLSDLGVSSGVITTLIQHDASPDTLARQATAEAVQPLPPGVGLTAPATNVYPPSINEQNQSAMPQAVTETAPATTYAMTNVDASAVSDASTTTYFYDSLAPYGTWYNMEDYGLVWQPTVVVSDPGWRPYSDRGRWLWTDSGWYWYSDYSWGWAPFHYGRWCPHPRFGWFWIPDRQWGPSWVTWRYTPYHCGWAPLPPDCRFVPGFGLFYHRGSVGVDFDFGFPPSHYTWIHMNRFCDPFPQHYFLPPRDIPNIYYQSVVANNISVHRRGPHNEGLPFQKVARATRGDIPKIAVHEQTVGSRRDGRPERLESAGRRPTVVAATLPKTPPPSKFVPGSAPAAPRARPTPATAAALKPGAGIRAGAPLPGRAAPPEVKALTAAPTAPSVGRDPVTGIQSPRPSTPRAGSISPRTVVTPPKLDPPASRASRSAPPMVRTGGQEATATAQPEANVSGPSKPGLAVGGNRSGVTVPRVQSAPAPAAANPARAPAAVRSQPAAPAASSAAPAAPTRANATENRLVQPFQPRLDRQPSAPTMSKPAAQAAEAPRVSLSAPRTTTLTPPSLSTPPSAPRTLAESFRPAPPFAQPPSVGRQSASAPPAPPPSRAFTPPSPPIASPPPRIESRPALSMRADPPAMRADPPAVRSAPAPAPSSPGPSRSAPAPSSSPSRKSGRD